MSLPKDKKFIVTLGGITLALAAGLIFVGLNGSSRYNAAKDSYQAASEQAVASESLPLYPNPANRDGKRKALGVYREDVSKLQNEFGKFRPAATPALPPQEFTTRLKAANTEIVEAFQAAKATVPEAFFSGFEAYTSALARETATGILDYQLGAAKEMLLALAKSNPSALLNVHRPALAEETGTAYVPKPAEVSRALTFEVSFKGPENSLRGFLSALAKSEKHFYVIRAIRIGNEKKTPPLAADGKFDAIEGAPTSDAAPVAPESAFVLTPEPAAPAVPGAAPPVPGAAPAAPDAAPVEPAAPAAPPAPVDTGRILSQVLGSEELEVFVRLDILQFLPAKELPQP